MKNKDFVEDDCPEYKFENVPIEFANLKNVYLDTKIKIVWCLQAETSNGFSSLVHAKITPIALDDPIVQ